MLIYTLFTLRNDTARLHQPFLRTSRHNQSSFFRIVNIYIYMKLMVLFTLLCNKHFIQVKTKHKYSILKISKDNG